MRKYQDMLEDYVEWYYEKTGDNNYNPDTFFEDSEIELNIKKGKVWKKILELSYNKENGIYWFHKFILGDLMYAGYPEPIRFNSLWWKWTKISKEGDHIAIKCGRQHGKSTRWTVVEPIYRTAMFEHYNILIESATEEQAIMLLGYAVKIIENNEFLCSKISKSAKWSNTEISYNGGKIAAKGVGSEVRGGTYDYIVCDDILRTDNKLSDREVENFIDEELEPMILVRGGQIVIVGTPKSDTDIFATINERINLGSNWKMYAYPAILDWDKKEVLCPDRFTFEQLLAKQDIMGKLKFDKEFMCQTYSSGTQLFPEALRKKAMDMGLMYNLYAHAKGYEQKEWNYYVGVDCARAGTAGGDYTVVTVIAYNPKTQVKKICWIWKEKGLKISEQVNHIAEIARNFDFPVILVERNNIGQEFIDQLVDNFNLHVEVFTTGSKGQSKDDLIRFLINAFEHEKIIMPMGNEYSRDMMKDLEQELSRFVVEITRAGNEVMKGSGHTHDDMVISLALANKATQGYGYSPFAVAIEKTSKTTPLERFANTGDILEVLRF